MAFLRVSAELFAKALLPGLDLVVDGIAFDYMTDSIVLKVEGPSVPAGADWCEAIYTTAADGTVSVRLEKGRA